MASVLPLYRTNNSQAERTRLCRKSAENSSAIPPSAVTSPHRILWSLDGHGGAGTCSRSSSCILLNTFERFGIANFFHFRNLERGMSRPTCISNQTKTQLFLTRIYLQKIEKKIWNKFLSPHSHINHSSHIHKS